MQRAPCPSATTGTAEGCCVVFLVHHEFWSAQAAGSLAQPLPVGSRRNTSQPPAMLFNRLQPCLQPAELLGRSTSQPTTALFSRLQPGLQPTELLGRGCNPTKTLPSSAAFNRAFNRLNCYDENTIQPTIAINNRLQPYLQPAGLLWRKRKSTDNVALQPPSTGSSTG